MPVVLGSCERIARKSPVVTGSYERIARKSRTNGSRCRGKSQVQRGLAIYLLVFGYFLRWIGYFLLCNRNDSGGLQAAVAYRKVVSI